MSEYIHKIGLACNLTTNNFLYDSDRILKISNNYLLTLKECVIR